MEVNPQGTTISEAAGLISQAREPEAEVTETEVTETQEVTEVVETTETEEVPESEETVETKSEDEPEGETEEEVETEELHTWESLNELREAAELTPEQFDNLKVSRKINGELEEVTLAELIAGNQRDADYRNKTMELAEQRKAFEEQQSQYFETQKSKVEQTDLLINQLNQQLVGDYNAINWAELEVSDPAAFAAEKVKFQERHQALQNAIQRNEFERNQITEQTQARQQEEFKSYLQEQEKLLLSKLPEWNNEKVKLEQQGQIRDYLKLQQFSDEEISQVYDHRHILLLKKAMAFDALDTKAAPKLKKVKELPKVVKPGAKVSKTEEKQNTLTQLKKTAKKTGDIKDAASLIGALRG